MADALGHRFYEAEYASALRVDPIRIVEAVITGVSFIGAGTISVSRGEKAQVRGLTTAASLLFSAAVGITGALNQWLLAASVTFLACVQCFGQKPLGSSCIALRREQKIQGVDGTIEVFPLTFDFHIGLVDAPRIVGRFQVWPTRWSISGA